MSATSVASSASHQVSNAARCASGPSVCSSVLTRMSPTMRLGSGWLRREHTRPARKECINAGWRRFLNVYGRLGFGGVEQAGDHVRRMTTADKRVERAFERGDPRADGRRVSCNRGLKKRPTLSSRKEPLCAASHEPDRSVPTPPTDSACMRPTTLPSARPNSTPPSCPLRPASSLTRRTMSAVQSEPTVTFAPRIRDPTPERVGSLRT